MNFRLRFGGAGPAFEPEIGPLKGSAPTKRLNIAETQVCQDILDPMRLHVCGRAARDPARESMMIDPKATAVPGNKMPGRRFLWLSVLSSVVVITVLEMAFPQKSLTAPIPDTVEMADMTWVEVRSAIAQGYTVAIVPSGGIEQNGTHMVLGKHDYIVRSAANRIAQQLGHALVTPVVSFVPEGAYDPPSDNMAFPGTLGVPEPVFAQVLEGIARSLKSAGFKTICFMGDHGGNQAAQAAVAAKLNSEWFGAGTTVLHVSDYYVDSAQIAYLREKGETPATIGIHAGIIDTSEMLGVHPQGVDLSRLSILPSHSEPAGHSGDPTRATAEYGTALLDIRINAAVRQIRAALQSKQVSSEVPM
jgi:creatinine amidohydrolase